MFHAKKKKKLILITQTGKGAETQFFLCRSGGPHLCSFAPLRENVT
jgi:hypothetical protein